MSWIDEELTAFSEKDKIANVAFLKFENNKILTLTIDFTNKFEKKLDKFDELKAHIPVKDSGIDKIWTLNTANPFYRELLNASKSGKTVFKIVKTGNGQDTRYSIVE